jgi:hypothetical protein
MRTAAIQAVAKERPYGTVTVNAVRGGIEIPTEQGSDAIVVPAPLVIVSLDDGKANGRERAVGNSRSHPAVTIVCASPVFLPRHASNPQNAFSLREGAG